MLFENRARVPLKCGRLSTRKPNYRTLLLSSYASALPPAESAWSNLSLISERIGSTPSALFPIDGNDQYGDCTIAGAGHLITLLAGLSGVTNIPDATSLIATYFKLTGGADSGLNLDDVLSLWQTTGIVGNEIIASVEIDPTNWDLVKQAIQFFGGVYIGMKVPTNAQKQFSQGVPWTGGRLTNDGHCVVITDYDASGGGTLITWGNKQLFTEAWYNECVDEVHAVVTSYTSVFDSSALSDLSADLKALGN